MASTAPLYEERYLSREIRLGTTEMYVELAPMLESRAKVFRDPASYYDDGMSYRGVHFAITNEERGRLLAAQSDEKLLELISDEIEERWDREWLVQTDKAWDAIHRCLTDGKLAYENGGYPLRLCILGGRQLYHGDDYVVSLKESSQCADIAAALGEVDEGWLRKRYFAIVPEDYGRELTEEDFEYTLQWFSELPSFYSKAGKANRSVIFTVDF